MSEMTTLEAVCENTNLYPDSSALAGSTIVYPYENESLPAIELGASIFVRTNKNLWRASTEFNLTRFGEGVDGMGDMGRRKRDFFGTWCVHSLHSAHHRLV